MKIKIGFLFLLIFLILSVCIFYFRKYDYSKPVNIDINEQDNQINLINSIQAKPSDFFKFFINLENQNKITDFSSNVLDEKFFLKMQNNFENQEDEEVALHFWASWCEPCLNEMPEIIEYVKKSKTQNKKMQVVLISLDADVDGLKRFMKLFPEIANKDLFKQVWDKENIYSNVFKIDRLPMTIFLSSKKSNQSVRRVEGVVPWPSL